MPGTLAPMEVGPMLVLTGQADAQEVSFHDAVPVGDRLRLFGAVHDAPRAPGAADDETPSADAGHELPPLVESSLESGRARRPARGGRLDLGRPARLHGCCRGGARGRPVGPFLHLEWRRGQRGAEQGWSPGYNFGSIDAAESRWRAAIDAGVDFIATDQYRTPCVGRAYPAREALIVPHPIPVC